LSQQQRLGLIPRYSAKSQNNDYPVLLPQPENTKSKAAQRAGQKPAVISMSKIPLRLWPAILLIYIAECCGYFVVYTWLFFYLFVLQIAPEQQIRGISKPTYCFYTKVDTSDQVCKNASGSQLRLKEFSGGHELDDHIDEATSLATEFLKEIL